MKTKIKVFSGLLLILLVALTLVVPLTANDGPRVIDVAGLFTDGEYEQLNQQVNDAIKKLGIDVVIVTTNDSEGKTGQAFADDYFDYNGYGTGKNDDGILLLFAMDIGANGEIVFSGHGKGVDYYTDSDIDKLLDAVFYPARNGNYASGAEAFVGKAVEIGYKKAHPLLGRFNATDILVSLGLGLALAAIVVGIMLAIQKSGEAKPISGRHYIADGFRETHRLDIMVGTNTTRTAIPQNTGGSGGGSGGGTRTHTSSSGRSHSGGSRRL